MADTDTQEAPAKATDTADALGINVGKLVSDSLALPSGSWATDLRTKLEKNQQDQEKELDPIRKKINSQYERDQSEADEARKAIDPTHIEPWTQKPPEPDPIQAFGSFGSAFAVLASAFTRQPAINALNASAAAMNAVRANDVEGYNEAHKAWKDNTTVALERHRQQMDDYHAAFDKMKTDMDAGRLMLTTAAQKYGDQQMLMLKEGDLLAQADNLVTSRANAARGMLNVLPRLEDMGETQKILMNDPDWLSGDPKRMAAAKARATQKATLGGAAAAAKDKEVRQEATALSADTDSLLDKITADPSLVGAKGMFRRGYQAVVGQTAPDEAHDKASEKFKADLVALRARIARVVLNARYFSGPAQKAAAELLPGLETFDDPGKVKAALETLKDILNSRQNQGNDSSDDDSGKSLKDLSDDEILKRLQGGGP